jgi:hypothetical protein
MVKQLLHVYDHRDEARRRAEAAYKMVHSTLIWDKQINPRWVKLFEAAAAAPNDFVMPSKPGDTSVLKGDLL